MAEGNSLEVRASQFLSVLIVAICLCISFNSLWSGIAMNTVMTAESTSAIGWAYIIPFIPQTIGRSRITGIKQIPCLQAPRIKPSLPFPKARNREEYTV